MAEIKVSRKACSVYPLKLSQPLGAIYALLGVKGSMPLVHGSQGCAAFAKTFLTRYFSENIPMQTTALSEIATLLRLFVAKATLIMLSSFLYVLELRKTSLHPSPLASLQAQRPS